MPTRRLYAIIIGEVQGIGFRWFVQKTARDMGVSGWVRNLSNGAVELEAEGAPQTLDVFFSRLRHGHPEAIVQNIDIEQRAAGQNPSGDFEIHF